MVSLRKTVKGLNYLLYLTGLVIGFKRIVGMP